MVIRNRCETFSSKCPLHRWCFVLCLALAVLGFSACGGGGGSSSGGDDGDTDDAAIEGDGGHEQDSGEPTNGEGLDDAGLPDAGDVDGGGAIDAGEPSDSGAPADAGESQDDTGAVDDGGVVDDAGPPEDAGGDDTGPPDEEPVQVWYEFFREDFNDYQDGPLSPVNSPWMIAPDGAEATIYSRANPPGGRVLSVKQGPEDGDWIQLMREIPRLKSYTRGCEVSIKFEMYPMGEQARSYFLILGEESPISVGVLIGKNADAQHGFISAGDGAPGDVQEQTCKEQLPWDQWHQLEVRFNYPARSLTVLLNGQPTDCVDVAVDRLDELFAAEAVSFAFPPEDSVNAEIMVDNMVFSTNVNPIWSAERPALQWQVFPSDPEWEPSPGMAHDYCNDLDLGGYDDWMLPTISQLRTLIRNCPSTATGGACGVTDACSLPADCWSEACNGCLRGPCFWPPELRGACSVMPYLSSINFQQPRQGHWAVNFASGAIVNESVGQVRCVRSADNR